MILADPTPITRDGAALDARHELAKPIYHHNSDSLVVRIFRWIGHLIDRALSNAFGNAPGGGWGALLLVVLVGGCIALIVWRLGPPARGRSAETLFTEASVVSAADHRRRAADAADAGDWHTAVIERMRAVARELEERGVLDVRPGRTATEVAGEAATSVPAAASTLLAAARIFNEVAFGDVAAGAEDLATVAAADDAVAAHTRQPVPV